MTKADLDRIRDKLVDARTHKRDIALAKAQKKIETINRESEAYWDGVYDAIKAVWNAMPDPQKGDEE